jgi:TrkA-N domain
MKHSEYPTPPKSLLRQFLHWWSQYQWPVVIVSAIATVYLGFIGFSEYFKAARSLWDCFYLSLQLFTLESGSIPGPKTWQLEVARLLAPALAAYTAIRALMAIFKERVQSFYMRFIKNHVVICGLGQKGFFLVKGFLQRGYRAVVIEPDEHNDFIKPCSDLGCRIIRGDATVQKVLQKACVDKARYLIAITGDNGANAEISVHAFEMVKDQSDKVLTCLVHIVEPKLCHLLTEYEVITEKSKAFKLEFFNIYEKGARALLKDYPAFMEEDKNKACQPHCVIVGFGSMGESLVIHAARQWLNAFQETGKKLCVTIVDKDAKRKAELLDLQYPEMNDLLYLNPQQMDIRWPEFQEAKFLYDVQGCCNVTKIYICFGDSSLNLSAALTLFQKVREQNIPIVVRVTQEAGFAKLLKELEHTGSDLKHIHPFALLDRTCQIEEILREMENPESC